MRNSCSIIPQIKNFQGDLVDSNLFTDLLAYTQNNRDLTKKIYLMSKKSSGLTTDQNGEVEMKDAVKFYENEVQRLRSARSKAPSKGVINQINEYLRASKKDKKYVNELEKGILAIHKRIKYTVGQTNLKIKQLERDFRKVDFAQKNEVKAFIEGYVQNNGGVYDTHYQNLPMYKQMIDRHNAVQLLHKDEVKTLTDYKDSLNKDLVDLTVVKDLSTVEVQYADLASREMDDIEKVAYDISTPDGVTELSNDYNFLQLFSKFDGMYSIKARASMLSDKLMKDYISPYIGELSTNNLNLSGLDNKQIDVTDLLANNPDIMALEKIFRGMGDYPRLEAQLVQSLTIEGVKKARANSDHVGKEILEHKKKLLAWAKKNGMKNMFGQGMLSKVYEKLSDKDHLNRVALVKPYTNQYYADVNMHFKMLSSKDKFEVTAAKAWLRDNHYNETKNPAYKNSKYTYIQSQPELKEFYEYFQTKVEETYEKLPEHVTLNNKYKIPSLIKDNVFDTLSLKPKNIMRSIGIILKTMVVGTGSPVFYDENGELQDQFTVEDLTKDQIRLKMIGEVDSERKSNDLGHVLHAFYSFGDDYEQMNKVLPIIRLIQNIVAKKTYGENGKSGAESRVNAAIDLYVAKTVTKTATKDKAPIKMLGTKIYDNYGNEIGENQFYWSTFVEHILVWTRLVQLGFNVASGVTNLFAGISANITEAAGSQYYGLKTYAKAMGIYMGDAFNQRTMFLHTDKNLTKVELLSEVFQPLDEVAEYDTRREIKVKNNNAVVRGGTWLLDKSFILQQLGEDVIHKSSMIAYMLDKKITGTDGNQHSLWSLFDVQNDQLKFNESIAGKPLEDFIKHDKETILAINAKNQGDYTKGNASVHSNDIAYKVGILFRKWLPAMIADRFQSRRYNFKTGNYDEGFFKSGSRAIAKNFTNFYLSMHSLITQNQDMLLYKKDITREEYIACRKILTDMMQILAMTIIPKLLIPPPDDDNKLVWYLPDWYEKWNPGPYRDRKEADADKSAMAKSFKYLNDFTNRVGSDRLQFYNVAKFPELIQRMAIFQQFKEVGEAFSALGNLAFGSSKNQKITRGINKGEYKALKEVRDIVPYWKQFDKIEKQGAKKYSDIQK